MEVPVAVDKSTAGRIIRALRSGTTPSEYAAALRVGQERWHKTALSMMTDTAEDEDFEVRFVRGAYGGGKTLFLRCLEAEALASGWVTAYIMLRHEQVELDRFHTIVSEISKRIVTKDGIAGMSALLSKALLRMAAGCGYSREKSNSLATLTKVDEIIKKHCAQLGLSFELGILLRAAMRALIDADDILWLQLVQWLSGGTATIEIQPGQLAIGPRQNPTRAQAIRLKPLGGSSANEILRLISLLAGLSGHTGLLLCFDELELIAGLPQRRRDQAFQTLRALIDNSDSNGSPRSTCMFFAATPFMFEEKGMFPSYKALQDRIETLRALGNKPITFREPIVDLDRTELRKGELSELAGKIVNIYEASGKSVRNVDGMIQELVDVIDSTKYVIAKPRLLCRCTVDLLDGIVQGPVQQHIAVVTNELDSSRKREIYSHEK
jgi:P-loop Domain of unknown function (DUF2791)